MKHLLYLSKASGNGYSGRKIGLIKWLTEISEPSIIKRLVELKKEQEIDWWDTISPEGKAGIEEGKRQADAGLFTPHNQVMKKYEKYL